MDKKKPRPTLTFVFDTDELMESFVGWYCDGGGEQDFANSVEDHFDGKLVTSDLSEVEDNTVIVTERDKDEPADDA